MYAVILAATHERTKNAKGKDIPIVLFDFYGEPLLTTLMKKLSPMDDMRRVVVITNETIKGELDDWMETLPHNDLQVHVLGDGTASPEERLGAMGDLLFAIRHERIADDLLVIGGDNWFTYDLAKFVEKSRQRSPSVAVSPYRARLNTSRFGLVDVDRSGRIKKFLEKPSESKFDLKASCVYFFSTSDIEWIDAFSKEHDTHCSPGTFFAWLVDRTPVYAVQMEANWYDIGEFQDPNLRGPDSLRIRNRIREKYNHFSSAWERQAARHMQWASSYEDLLDCLEDSNPNTRIAAATILGEMEDLIDKRQIEQVVSTLIIYLADDAMNQIGSAEASQSTDDEIYFVCAAAANALVHLGYAKNASAVFNKAKSQGFYVKERKNIVA